MKENILAAPTRSGNGFTAGRLYNFHHTRNMAYEAVNDNGHRRVECYPFGEHSPHLWDGYGDYEQVAGRFEEVT